MVGANSDPEAASLLSAIYAPLTTGDYYTRPDAIAGPCSVAHPPTLLLTSTKSAEIIKHASNAFLALKISFINAVSNLCEATDANVEQVARGMGLDSRIGPKFLRPGIGYGGSCFPKDVAAFRSVAEQLGIDFNLLTEVEKINYPTEETLPRQGHAPHSGRCVWKAARVFSDSPSRVKRMTFANRRPSSRGTRCCSRRRAAAIAAYDPAAMKGRRAAGGFASQMPQLARYVDSSF